jgi:hypothetical protein
MHMEGYAFSLLESPPIACLTDFGIGFVEIKLRSELLLVRRLSALPLQLSCQ